MFNVLLSSEEVKALIAFHKRYAETTLPKTKDKTQEWYKQSELQRHLDFYRCLNMSKGAYCE